MGRDTKAIDKVRNEEYTDHDIVSDDRPDKIFVEYFLSNAFSLLTKD